MVSLVARVTNRHQLPKKLVPGIPVMKMMNSGSRCLAASLADSLCAKKNQSALLLPFGSLEVFLVSTLPLFGSLGAGGVHLRLAKLLSAGVELPGDLVGPIRNRRYLRFRKALLGDVLELISALVALLENADHAIGCGLLARRRAGMFASRLLLPLTPDGIRVRILSGDPHSYDLMKTKEILSGAEAPSEICMPNVEVLSHLHEGEASTAG